MASIPDLNNSALTLGPTFPTLLKSNYLKDLSKFNLIFSIIF